MEWTITDAKQLLAIDQEIGEHNLSPAEYEIVRRVIYETGDFDYLEQLYFSDRALTAGAAALSARTPIIVDDPMLKAGIIRLTQHTFVNPVYCCFNSHPHYGITVLAKRYPKGIFITGKKQTTFKSLIKLIEDQKINPAFVIITLPKLIEKDSIEKQLAALTIPHVSIKGRKGSSSVAMGIFQGLIDLSWQLDQQSNAVSSNS